MSAKTAWWTRLERLSDGASADPTRRRDLLYIVLIVFGLFWLVSGSEAWRLVEARSFDYLSTISPPAVEESSPIIVAIDEPSMSEFGLQWPWPRSLHAQLVESLRKAGARVIALDIIFAEPSNPESDAALTAALGPDVVLAGDVNVIDTAQGLQQIRVEPVPDFTGAGAVTGIASITLDADGPLRRLPQYDDGFALRTAQSAGLATSVPENALIQTFGPARTFETVSYYQALDPDNFLPEGKFRDKTVIVGLSLQAAPSIASIGADAYATSYTLRSGRLVAGAEIQATIYDNLARSLFITQMPFAAKLAIGFSAALLAACVVWRGTGWKTLLAVFLAAISVAAGSYAALKFGRLFMPPVAPFMAFALVAGAQGARDYAAERRLRKGITRAFSHYLSPVLVDRLASDPAQLKLGGETRTLTVLFCDVRGFTTISESLKDDPQRLTALVNRLLTPLSKAILDAGGTIDKYIGDCIMAFWNAPLDDPDHALHAIEAAVAMLDALEKLNAELEAEATAQGALPMVLRIGIGINTGDCVVGNMGSDTRFDYSALGDAVNLASRLEGRTKDYDLSLLLGPETSRLLSGRADLVEIDRLTVKGKSEVITVSTLKSLSNQAS